MIEFRPAGRSDADAIAALHARSFRENNGPRFDGTFLETDLPAELIQLWRERLGRPNEDQFLQVALDEAGLAGFVCAYGGLDDRLGSLIDNLHVDRRARRTGVGSSLLTQAGSWLDGQYPEKAVHLFVLDSNHVARRFYERLGGRDVEGLEMPSHGGMTVRNRRYHWTLPREISAE